jgi:hypothetical protein
MLTELEMQNRKAARDGFIQGVWQGMEPAKLLSLANAAGLTAKEADEFIVKISQGKEHVEHVSRLSALRKEAASTKAKLDKIDTHATAEISRLQSEVEDAAIANNAAQKALNAAEDSARRLLMLHDQGLLPLEDAPKEVRYLAERRAAEEKSWQADSARAVATADRDRRLAVVHDLEVKLANLPITLGGRRDEFVLRNLLKDARRHAAEAEDRLKQAQADADAARKAIP